MAENYIATYYIWVIGDTITADRLNGNNSNIIDGLSGGVKAVNLGKILINGTESLNSSREISGTKLTIDNIIVNGNDISSSSGDITITPATGNDVIIDGHFEFDGNVLTGITDDNTSIVPYTGKAVVLDSHFSFDGTTITALTDNNTTINAYTGKNITIESVTLDGGVVGGVTNLTATGTVKGGTVQAYSASTSAFVEANGVGGGANDYRTGAKIYDNGTLKWRFANNGVNDYLFIHSGATSATECMYISSNGQNIGFANLGTLSGKADLQYDTSSKSIGYVSSALRYKKNIEPIHETNWIYDLKPRTFERLDNPGIKENGLIADEVAEIKNDLVLYKSVEDVLMPETVSYSSLITPMLDQIQKLNKRITELEARLQST